MKNENPIKFRDSECPECPHQDCPEGGLFSQPVRYENTCPNMEKNQLLTEVARMFFKIGVLKNFGKITGKNMCQSHFYNKVAGQARNFIKNETLAQGFSCEF